MTKIHTAACLLGVVLSGSCTAADVEVSWLAGERTWVGPDCWANRLQDWRVKDGRLECVESRHLAMRTVHLLTARLVPRGALQVSARLELANDPGERVAADTAGGFLIGVGGDRMDRRAAAIVHGWAGPGGGLFAGVRPDGRVFFVDFEREGPPAGRLAPVGALSREGWRIVRVDSVEPESGAENAVDGDAESIWHTQWREAKPPHPHEIVIALGSEQTTTGFAYLARQDSVSGRVNDYEVYVSSDGKSWGEPAVAGNLADSTEVQRVTWPGRRARFFKLVARSSHSRRPSTTVAELWLLGAEGDSSQSLAEGREPTAPVGRVPAIDLQLTMKAPIHEDDVPTLTLRSLDSATGRVLGEASRPAAHLTGNLAFVSHPGTRGAGPAGRWAFGRCTLRGGAVEAHPEAALGSILSAQYTISRGVLKLTAQLFPLGEGDDRTVRLEVQRGGKWSASVATVEAGFTATLRLPNWDATKDTPYRLTHTLPVASGPPLRSTWGGVFRRDPVDRNELVLAGLSCNHNNSHAIGRPSTDWVEGMWFPHTDLVRGVRRHEPDLLFFPGDQIYEGKSPTFADRQHLELDYLYKWYLWCWAYRELTRSTPCVVIPDDHDVYQGNLWGEGGRPAVRDHLGGYVRPAGWVQMIERTQTSHLPDPFDPTPIEQGIGVYYTHLVWGGVSFAILEDRKWKSGCKRPEMPPSGTGRPDHFNDPEFDTGDLDRPGLELLGARQLEFLRQWTRDWRGAKLKCVLSQTVFANLATHHGADLSYLIADLDSNGWPQSGRHRALAEIQRAFAPHIAGDQHLATLSRHGLDGWDDSVWSFCLPATANFYPRAWWPPCAGADRPEGAPPWMGRHRDGFGNRVTVHAATNPGELGEDGKWTRKPTGRRPADLHDKMPGYGIVRFDKSARSVTFECWPRAANPARDPQYPGWPRTVMQTDNYAPPRAGWLPTLHVDGVKDPLVEVFDAGGLVYALRPKSLPFTPWVFAAGDYSLRVSDPEAGRLKQFGNLRAIEAPDQREIRASF